MWRLVASKIKLDQVSNVSLIKSLRMTICSQSMLLFACLVIEQFYEQLLSGLETMHLLLIESLG